MPSRFEERFQAFAVPNFNREFGVTVRFIQGVNTSEEFTARRNDRMNKAVGTSYGTEIGVTMRYFILPVASVAIDGDEVEPRTGNRLMEGDEIFEIQPPDENTPSVELLTGGFEWGVYTKRVE